MATLPLNRAGATSVSVLLTFSACFAQQYIVTTLAGGSPPPTPVEARKASLSPATGIAVDAAGNVFLMNTECVFRLNSNGILTRIAGNSRRGFSGDGGPALDAQLGIGGVADGLASGLTLDPAGNLYLTERENSRVRKIAVSGIITTIAGSGSPFADGDGGPAVKAGLGSPTSVVIDRKGNVFIAEQPLGQVRKVSPDGLISTIYTGVSDNTEGVVPSMSLALDHSDNLLISQTNSHRIRKLTPDGTITTIGGTGTSGFSGDGGPAVSAQIASPVGLVAGPAGDLFFVDSQNNRVRRIAANGTITTIAGGGTISPADGVQATKAQLFRPNALAIDARGNLYVSAGWLQKISPDGVISILAGNGKYSFAGDGGPAISAQLFEPSDVALDGNGNVFVVDSGNQAVRRIDSSGTITTIAGTGDCGSTGDGGPATSAALCFPSGAATDLAGNLYIADGANNRIRRITPSGTISTVAGNGSGDFAGDGGLATLASIHYPLAVTVDTAGNLFIADYLNNRVRKVSAKGLITTVAGTGTPGFSGDGGPATEAELFIPNALAVDGNGNLFVSDAGNLRIRKVSPDGAITTVAGNGSLLYPGDGSLAVEAGLFSPNGVAVDAEGNLFIAEFTRIRMVSKDGRITTIAGNDSFSDSGDGVPAYGTAIGAVMGMKMDSQGRLYFAGGSNSVRVLQPVTQSILVGAIVDGASQSAIPIAPGKVVVIYGAGLGPPTLVTNQPVNGRYSIEAGGTEVSVNGIAAPLLYASSTQIGALVPYGITGPTTQFQVSYGGSKSDAASVPVAPSRPSLFSANQTGAGQAAAVNGDGTLNDAAHPVPAGGYLSLYATGEGQTSPESSDGELAAGTLPLPHPKLPVSVKVGGQTAQVVYAGSAPGEIFGLMQVVIQIPATLQPGGYVPVVLQVGDASTVDGALWIAVSNP